MQFLEDLLNGKLSSAETYNLIITCLQMVSLFVVGLGMTWLKKNMTSFIEKKVFKDEELEKKLDETLNVAFDKIQKENQKMNNMMIDIATSLGVDEKTLTKLLAEAKNSNYIDKNIVNKIEEKVEEIKQQKTQEEEKKKSLEELLKEGI